ncbi:hypothetical protein B566_EDAN008960 [Ephemera danica]|nr:hypothetical protein B566_EDAN008960 [Ephemera danica]
MFLKVLIMNYYEILGVSNEATFEEIKKRYQDLALKLHPDKSKGNHTEKFIELNNAWTILRDTRKRKEYDSILVQKKLNEDVQLYATVEICDLTLEDDGSYSYYCRCGGIYSIAPSQVDLTDCVIPCEDCSLSILFLAGNGQKKS